MRCRRFVARSVTGPTESGSQGEIRVGRDPSEEIVGERSVVLDLIDDDPIYVRPVKTGPIDLQGFARRLDARA